MLVIHWARQNKTSAILANGIRPAARKGGASGAAINSKGVYVYPFSRNKTLIGNWRRNLKTWDNSLGNYNGFVFRLEPEDFPLLAGLWWGIRMDTEYARVASMPEMAERCGDHFSGAIADKASPDRWKEFEIIVPRHVDRRRIIKVIRDREPRLK